MFGIISKREFKKQEDRISALEKDKATRPTTTATELNYTERYEYACSLIKLYLDREEATERSAQPGYVSVFANNSVMYTTFTMDFRMLTEEVVANQIIRNLRLTEDNKSSNMPLVRFYNVFYDVVASVGLDFIKELTRNMTGALLLTSNVNMDSIDAAKARLSQTLAAVPIILLFILGAKDYNTRFIQKRTTLPAPQLLPSTTHTDQK